MKIIFISNYFTHHQKPLSDALFELTKGNYIFLATEKMSDDRKSQGWTIDSPSYVQELDKADRNSVEKYIQLINDADIVIQGSRFYNLIEARTKHKNKLTFIFTERLYKSAKRYLKVPIYLYRGIKFRSCYILAASAFAPIDYSVTRGFIGKCLKFGYFPATHHYSDIDELFKNKDVRKIVWVARMIDWKHPEVPIEVARILKQKGYKFQIEMIGTGYLSEKIRMKIKELDLADCISQLGSIPSDEVRAHMESAGIALITSDKNEGWGAVMNEAMNSGCVVISNSEIGAAPYLIRNHYNGFLYNDTNTITELIIKMFEDAKTQKIIGTNALRTITEQWNAEEAAKRIIKLYDIIKLTDIPLFSEGPCSNAPLIKTNWIKCH